ncbi:MAG: hypothetical protein AB1427_13960 [Thermodesulfobacteriota bacterium]
MSWKFWEKKQEGAAPEGAEVVKYPGPKRIHESVGRYLVVRLQADPDWVWSLKEVERQRPESKSAFDVRVYDERQTAAKNVTIKNYTTLDAHPDLILYEGWFDKKSMKVQIEDRKAPPRAA